MPQAGSHTVLARLGIDHLDDGVNERARSEVLTGADLHLGSVALQQALVDGALHVHAKAEPGLLIDQLDKALQLGRIVDRILRLPEQRSEQAILARQLSQSGAVSPVPAPRL